MQLEQDNTGQLIAYTGVYPGEHPIPSALALALVRDFADSITRVTDPDVCEVHEPDLVSDTLRALLDAVEVDSFPARYDDAVRCARMVLGR